MTEQRVVGRDHQIGVGALVEVPAVAVALGLDDADLLELLQRSVARLRRWRTTPLMVAPLRNVPFGG